MLTTNQGFFTFNKYRTKKKKKKIINYFIIQGLIKSPEYDCIIIDYSVPKGRHLQEKVFRLNTNLITVDLKEKKKKIRVNIPL